METKSTNEVKSDYDRVSASECLGSLIELHGIVMEDDLFVIPDADGTAVLYNDGKIRFDEIADIEVGSVFVGILLRNGERLVAGRVYAAKVRESIRQFGLSLSGTGQMLEYPRQERNA